MVHRRLAVDPIRSTAPSSLAVLLARLPDTSQANCSQPEQAAEKATEAKDERDTGPEARPLCSAASIPEEKPDSAEKWTDHERDDQHRYDDQSRGGNVAVINEQSSGDEQRSIEPDREGGSSEADEERLVDVSRPSRAFVTEPRHNHQHRANGPTEPPFCRLVRLSTSGEIARSALALAHWPERTVVLTTQITAGTALVGSFQECGMVLLRMAPRIDINSQGEAQLPITPLHPRGGTHRGLAITRPTCLCKVTGL